MFTQTLEEFVGILGTAVAVVALTMLSAFGLYKAANFNSKSFLEETVYPLLDMVMKVKEPVDPA